MIRLIRKSSDTPNVSNLDDCRHIRYAYGGANGYVKSYGSECGYNVESGKFVVGSAVLALQGWEAEIDANGVEISIPSGVSTTLYWNVIFEVNLANETTRIYGEYTQNSYPEFTPGDDLTQVTSGTAKLLLYQFTSTSGIVSNIQKKVNAILYSEDRLQDVIDDVNVAKLDIVDIERRLDELGFKQGSFEILSGAGTATANIIFKQGNYVYFNLIINVTKNTRYIEVIFDSDFYPTFFAKGYGKAKVPYTFGSQSYTMDLCATIYNFSPSDPQDSASTPGAFKIIIYGTNGEPLDLIYSGTVITFTNVGYTAERIQIPEA